MLAAIVVGVWAMIFMTALMRGMVDDMIKDGISVLPGHVQIHHPDYRDDPSDRQRHRPSGRELCSRPSSSPEVVAWATRVRVPAVISSERDTRGVTLIGIEPERERDISFVADDMVEGRFLESRDDRGLVVGRKLVEKLETGLGKRVVIMSQDPENEIADRGFRIVGIFESKLAQYEEGYVFAGEGTIQDLLGVGDQVSEVAILGTDYRNVDGSHRIDADGRRTRRRGPAVERARYLSRLHAGGDGWFCRRLDRRRLPGPLLRARQHPRHGGLRAGAGDRPDARPRYDTAQHPLPDPRRVHSSAGHRPGHRQPGGLGRPSNRSRTASMSPSSAKAWSMFGAASMLYPALYLKDVILANVIVIVLGLLRQPLAGLAGLPLRPGASHYKGVIMKSVRCIDLCKTYRQGEVEVTGLDHVNLEIEEGGFVCLSAPSGGGKTTLLNAIGGLDTPDSGEIWLAGNRVDNLGKGELAKMRLHQIGFVFQAYNLIPVLTARENVEFVMEVQGVAAEDRRTARSRSSRRSGWLGSRTGGLPRCRAASNSGWRWRGRLPPGRRWSSPTSLPPTSTPRAPTS